MNIIYNASAGTGKTYQITQYYQKLVIDEEINPRDILLMTFSENAGAELRDRVTQRLQEIRETGNDEQSNRAIEALHCLSSAFIGTIHAFCTRILRENALEIGLAPNFDTLIDNESTDLIQQIARQKLLEHLETDPHFRTFCSGAQPLSFGNGFGTSVTETVADLIEQAEGLDIDLKTATELLPSPQPLPSFIDFEQICTRIEELPKRTPSVEDALGQIKSALENRETIEELIEQLTSIKIRKAGKVKEIATDFMNLKEAATETLHYRKAFPAAQAFARYLESTVQAFHHAKQENNTIDFNDQLKMALQLLQTNLPSPYKYIIVDEVQDTSRIQCQIIKILWQKETRLIICGDKKQSIYTWRGADPEVMPDLEEAIQTANGKSQPLQTSYRTKPQILTVINTLFKSIYTPEVYTEDQHLHSIFKTPNEHSCVEFLASDLDPETPKKDRIDAEMQAIARRIEHVVSKDSPFQPQYRYNGETFTPTSEANAYQYSDILILLRRTKHQSALEHALQHAQIPYTLGGKGKGLFTRTEVRDVALFLSTLTNPSDLFSLIGFLRSPWIGLSDEEIALLSKTDSLSAKTLLTAIETAAHPAAKTIQKYRKLLATHLASELVRLLIEETHFDALLAAQPRGTQQLANLQKLIDWLRKTERGARTTPGMVARKLAEKIKNPPPVPEAALPDPSQNVVTIMTVHGSKGLSSRVVFIPDVSGGQNADRSFCRVFAPHNATPSLCLKITQPNKTSVQSPNFKIANEYAKKMRDHEAKNLLYVAATRARDLLIFSATVGTRAQGWLSNLQPFINDSTLTSIPYAALKLPPKNIPTPSIPTAAQLVRAIELLPPPLPHPTLQRLPATRAGKANEPSFFESQAPSDMTSNLGSLGHAVLEQLALNNWNGQVSSWLEKLCPTFFIKKTETAVLLHRIERARTWMQKETLHSTLFPELPFVLHHENQLIDGTIDLLCLAKNKITLFDYKFTNQSDEALKKSYRGQMEIYAQAAQQLYPNIKTIEKILVILSKTALRTLSL